MELYCRRVSIFDEQLMEEFSREHLDFGLKILGGDASLISGKCYHDFENFYEWFKVVNRLDLEEDLQVNEVGCSVYLVFKKTNDKLVGIFDIRHGLGFPNGLLLGHIGVDIRPKLRGEGYYHDILKLCIGECRKNKILNIVISCEYDNIASKRGIEHLFKCDKEMIPMDGTYLYVYKLDLNEE